jgi:hypothetical protein
MPLPAEPFVIGRWFRYKLAPDYHVNIDTVGHFPTLTSCGIWDQGSEF